MAQYICSICGYIHDEAKDGKWESLPANWRCPVCKAGKDAFRRDQETASVHESLQKPHVERELSPMEMSIICSNLARGCEKQYMAEQSECFKRLAEFFRSKGSSAQDAGSEQLLELIEEDLSVGYPYGKAVASKEADRGALRCQVWSEKVTIMLRSLLERYETEGEKMLEHTGVWVCSICGFVWIGDTPPEICPVCKVPAWKFEKVEGRAQHE